MRDSEIMTELFQRNVLITLEEKYGKFLVQLIEPQAADSKVTIRNLPADAMVIKGDAFHSLESIFNGGRGECKRADYIIISEEKRCILFIEIKMTTDSGASIEKQLMGSQCFIKYCKEIGKIFWNEAGFLKDYKNRFIAISHTKISISKRRTRYDKDAEKHDTPAKAMKISYPPSKGLPFKKLVGK